MTGVEKWQKLNNYSAALCQETPPITSLPKKVDSATSVCFLLVLYLAFFTVLSEKNCGNFEYGCSILKVWHIRDQPMVLVETAC